ncbi:MAG: ABC transporter permease [Candidatus Calescibacterium sp.]|nr:ABC transporter permease [Candidatus Calescibacterium sp.]MCX7734779.1 ABC transporter permease [bacterium]MDW8087370.1 ABC transporter permease [Candidatus Calescibacterium sp.]
MRELISFIFSVIRKTPSTDIVQFIYSFGRVLGETFLPLIIFGTALGVSISIEFILALKVIGGEAISSYFITITVLREIGPMIAGSMVVIRSGTRITAEISSMKDRGILISLEVFPVDSFSYIALPRFWAIVFATVVFLPLSILLCFASAYFLVTYAYGVSSGMFWDGVISAGSTRDIFVGFIKCFIIGLSNATFSVFYGWNAKEGAEGLSEAVKKSINKAVVLGIVINYILSVIFF